MKKLVFFALFLLVFSLPVFAKDYYWKSIDTTLTINPDSTIDAVEVQAFVFSGNFSFAYRYFNLNNVADIADFTVFDEKAKSFLPVSQADEFRRKKFTWHYSATNDERAFVLRYKAIGAVTGGISSDELFWTAVFADHEKPVNSASLTVIFPEDIDFSKLRYDAVPGYSFEKIDSRTIRFLTGMLPARKPFDVRISFQKEMLNLPFNPAAYLFKIISESSLLIAIILLVLIAVIFAYVFASVYWKMEKFREIFIKPREYAAFSEEEKSLVRLKPAIAGAILDEKIDAKAIIATIIDLAQRGYIFIREEPGLSLIIPLTNPDFVLLKTKTDYSRLLNYEKELMELVFGSKSKIKLSELKGKFGEKNASRIGKIQSMIFKEAVRQELFTKNPEKLRGQYKAKAGIYGDIWRTIAGISGVLLVLVYAAGPEILIIVFALLPLIAFLLPIFAFARVLFYSIAKRKLIVPEIYGQTAVLEKNQKRMFRAATFGRKDTGMLVTGFFLILLLEFVDFSLSMLGFAAALVSCIACYWQIKRYIEQIPVATAKGEIGKQKYSELKEWIKKYPLMEERIFNEFLPYTIAFGIQDYWIKKFEGLHRQIKADWYAGSSGFFDATSFRLFNSGFNSTLAASMRGGFSVGFGGGGFGGGGGAGGGGGGAG